MKANVKGQDLEIVELRIQMHTNMDTQVELTADIIDNKKVSGKYPFLCTNYNYSDSILTQKTQNEIFDIFFNRTNFYNFILASKIKKSQNPEKKYDSDIVKSNIVKMLNAIFKISFPINDNVILMDPENIDIIDIVKNLFKNNKYTYLKLNKPSTVTQVIWLNTISSNPYYYKIYKKNKDYYRNALEYAEDISGVNIKSTDVEKILTDGEKIIFYRNLFKNAEDGENIPPNNLKLKEEWILYLLVSNLKKNTKEYNDFIKKYVEKFINYSEDRRPYYNISPQQYERQFYESVPEIKFYQEYISDMVELLPPKRISLDTSIYSALKTAKDASDFNNFIKLYTEKPEKYCDLIKLDNGAYEIHLGVAVVGGKVNKTNYKFFCNYNSHRLGNNLNYLIRDVEEESEQIRLYGYIDLENVNDNNEYIGVVNSNIKRKGTEKEITKGGNKTRKRRKKNKASLNTYGFL